MQLRPYQKQCIDAVFKALEHHSRVLAVLPTGSGKSLVCAALIEELQSRVLILCHSREVLSQNLAEYCSRGNEADVYCDALQKKQCSKDVVFATPQSFFGLDEPPLFETVIVDECHLVPTRSDSMYQTIFNRVGYKRLIGLTATPYRLDGGLMYGLNTPDPRLGKKRALPKSSKFFDICAYNLQLSDLIKWGFLSPYVVKTVDSPLVEGAELERSESTGEFTNTDDPRAWQANIAASVEYILEHTKDRKLTLIFCCGVRHAEHVAGIIRTYGHAAVSIDAKTPNRDALINNFKRDDSRYRYVVNCQTMTTGVNIPRIDCVVMARPTMSSSLFVQMAGRGLRLHPGKKDCLILDITDNTVNFGSLDDPMIFGTPTAKTMDIPLGLGEATFKQCPKCRMDVPSATRACPHCNHIFIKPKEFYGDGQIHTIKLKPSGYHWKQQITKAGLPAIVLTMQTEAGRIDTWLNINHHNQWVARRGRAALTLLRSGKPLKWIKAYKNAKGYWEIMSYHTSDL